MKHFENILVALDFKEAEQAEIDHALNLARSHKSKLTFMSVIPGLAKDAHLEISAMSPQERLELQISKRKTRLEHVAECIREYGLEVDCITVVGTPCDEIVRQSIGGRHDLLMVSERDRQPKLKSRLIGSTARQVIRKAPCPVWAVHPAHSGNYDRILVSIDVNYHEDYSNAGLNKNILNIADAISRIDHSELSMISLPVSEKDKADHLARLRSTLAENGIEIPDERIYQQTGEKTSTVIAQATRDHNTDLLVMGMLSKSRIKGFFIGNTVERVMDTVECSILTIKPDEFVCPIVVDD